MRYQEGETIRLMAVVTDSVGLVVNPVTMKISINKPTGVADISSADMTHTATGSYRYDYVIPAVSGRYRYNTTAVGLTDRITIVKDSFTVESSL